MGRIRSFCRLFAPLNFSLFYQAFFLRLDAFKQDGCRFIIQVLLYKFAVMVRSNIL